MTEQRIQKAYDTFRGGIHGSTDVPQWDEAPNWVRDAMWVAYLQGKLDGRSAPRDEPMSVERASALPDSKSGHMGNDQP